MNIDLELDDREEAELKAALANHETALRYVAGLLEVGNPRRNENLNRASTVSKLIDRMGLD